MLATAVGLLDVLKEMLKLEQDICWRLSQLKERLIAGRIVDVNSIFADIETVCSSIIESEQRRQMIVEDIAREYQLDVSRTTVEDLFHIPAFLSKREELSRLTHTLRQTLTDIIRLRNEVDALALQAQMYSETMLRSFQELAQKNTYGAVGPQSSQFFSVRT